MNRQSRLMVLKRTPLAEIEGYSKTCSGNYVQMTHVNKGKVYPCHSRTSRSLPPSSSTGLAESIKRGVEKLGSQYSIRVTD